METGFITNPAEASKLQSKRHQQALASSIHSGVRQFFQQNPPPGTYLAWLRDSKQATQLAQISQAPRSHVVSAGENLLKISQRYGVSLTGLRSANRLEGDTIKVGQTLTIPATTLAIQP
ncbi:membrane-bound lytic murein transglycosylase D [compost metagenome]